jgi:hypothetical protein
MLRWLMSAAVPDLNAADTEIHPVTHSVFPANKTGPEVGGCARASSLSLLRSAFTRVGGPGIAAE